MLAELLYLVCEVCGKRGDLLDAHKWKVHQHGDAICPRCIVLLRRRTDDG